MEQLHVGDDPPQKACHLTVSKIPVIANKHDGIMWVNQCHKPSPNQHNGIETILSHGCFIIVLPLQPFPLVYPASGPA